MADSFLGENVGRIIDHFKLIKAKWGINASVN